MGNFVQYLRESREELRKVSWPNKKQVWQYTVLIIVISIFTALFLGGLDFFFSTTLAKFVF